MIHSATWSELSPALLHDIVRLRVDVFVVEQSCPYPELDGRDVEASTLHVWAEHEGRAEHDGMVAGYLRVLGGPGAERRIGRVCVAAAHRGSGVARHLMAAALELTGDRPIVLDAQSHLAGWYARLGFTPSGPEFLEDGIAHVPMVRTGERAR